MKLILIVNYLTLMTDNPVVRAFFCPSLKNKIKKNHVALADLENFVGYDYDRQ